MTYKLAAIIRDPVIRIIVKSETVLSRQEILLIYHNHLLVFSALVKDQLKQM